MLLAVTQLWAKLNNASARAATLPRGDSLRVSSAQLKAAAALAKGQSSTALSTLYSTKNLSLPTLRLMFQDATPSPAPRKYSEARTLPQGKRNTASAHLKSPYLQLYPSIPTKTKSWIKVDLRFTLIALTGRALRWIRLCLTVLTKPLWTSSPRVSPPSVSTACDCPILFSCILLTPWSLTVLSPKTLI